MEKKNMIQSIRLSSDKIRKAYDRRSKIYEKTIARVEWSNHVKAIDSASIRAQDRILEVAVGPGLSLLEMIGRVDPDNIVYGVDLSQGMLEIARRRLTAAGYNNFVLKQADARSLPFEDNQFDLLYNAYMLDLIPLEGMSGVLSEFHRVLKPQGRLVLLNMSKPSDKKSFRELVYQILPPTFVLYVLGGCRPVLMSEMVQQEGFGIAQRIFVNDNMPSEIIVAEKM